jgi:hypothetical protein
MSLAERTRDAARDHPFLVDALRAGVVNYSAGARYLDVDGDDEAVATALRRFADDLPTLDASARDVRVRMERGIGRLPDDEDLTGREDALLAVSGTAFGADADGYTAVLATGDVDRDATRAALDALAIADVAVDALAYADDVLAVVVPSLDAANALRAVERALDAVPSDPR